jgi:hypothetical protein
MAIQLIGVLELPLQSPSTKTKLRFTCTSGVGPVLKTAPQVYTCDATGNYDFLVNYGMYIIEVMYSSQWNFLGHVNVIDTLTSPTDINTLLQEATVPIPINAAELPSYNVLNPMGDWDASTTHFPPNPLYPLKLADTWRISVGGTMDNGTYTMTVREDDVVYWSIVAQRWRRLGSTFETDDIALAEGEVLAGGEFGHAEAVSMANLITQQIAIHTFDGTSNSIDIVHNKNRKVYPLYFGSDGVIEYPSFAEVDSNTLRIVSAGMLDGTLILF